MIKAVVFDIDGVLLDSFEANLNFFQGLMNQFGYEPPTRESYVDAFHLPMLTAVKKLTGSTDEQEIEKIFQAGRNRDTLYDESLLRTPPRVEEILDVLSQKYELGIVTSRVKEGIYVLPQLAKIEKFFKTTVSFDDTVEHKPSPEPLLLAAKNLGIKPEEAVYIGDVKNDAIAAKAAGMRMIIYSKTKVDDVDFNTEDFSEIPSLVDDLNN